MKTSRIRSSKRRSYKKVYYIVTEGKTTEPSYFKIVDGYIANDGIAISCHPADKSSIPSILEKAKSLAAQKSQEKDEVWVVTDQDLDSHLTHQFTKLMEWGDSSSNHHVVISVPRFEFWLLCHFESSPTKNNALHDSYVAQYLPGYDRKKDLARHRSKITEQSIRHAIKVASRFPLSSYDSPTPGSDVWKLVQAILSGQ